MSLQACKICGNTSDNKTFVAKEMMFGLKDEFEYVECATCGCLQIVDIPANITRYYPDNYYSYQSKGEDHFIRRSLAKRLKRALKKRTLDFYLKGSGLIGQALTSKFESYYPWLKKGMVGSDSKILDVGCGSGELLLRMYNDGFTNLTGVDPYIQEEIHYSCGITIHKKNLEDVNDRYQLVMMHHAFEHMNEPLQVLKGINRLLLPGGHLIVRIPVAGSYAWRKYGVNWVQLDAPRHFYLHTQKSIKLLSEESGFQLKDVQYDSYDLQFTGSEKYLMGLALVDPQDPFTEEQKASFKKEAEKLNVAGEGDAACFYLEKV
ncbi:MAG TPA: class I SAM-dependent methyltransferase [Flavisolibacter sp.]|jgi:SAM-dependent methyltransferase|nr:class I SAM-dependent methyltransferase [Flavisolibacter sp.]